VSTGIALLFFDHDTRRGARGQRHVPAALYPREDPVPIVQEAEWAPGPISTSAENLAPTGIPSPAVQPVASRYTDYSKRPTDLGGGGGGRGPKYAYFLYKN